MLFTSPQLQREFVKSHFKGSACKVRTYLELGENAIFCKIPMLRFVIKLRHSFFLGHPYFEDWLSQVIMAALNIKTMKFSSNFSDSVEEPSEIMDNSRPNGVRTTYHHYHRCPYGTNSRQQQTLWGLYQISSFLFWTNTL